MTFKKSREEDDYSRKIQNVKTISWSTKDARWRPGVFVSVCYIQCRPVPSRWTHVLYTSAGYALRLRLRRTPDPRRGRPASSPGCRRCRCRRWPPVTGRLPSGGLRRPPGRSRTGPVSVPRWVRGRRRRIVDQPLPPSPVSAVRL